MEVVPVSKSLKLFRRVSWAEGLSFIILLFIAMPLKYAFGFPLAVKVVGWAHGLLFMAYFVVGLRTAQEEKWSTVLIVQAGLASVVPFGPFILDRRLAQD